MNIIHAKTSETEGVLKSGESFLCYRATPGDITEIVDLFVAMPNRRQGVATALINGLIETSTRPRVLYVFTRRSNTAACLLYASLGFREVAVPNLYPSSYPDNDGCLFVSNRLGQKIGDPEFWRGRLKGMGSFSTDLYRSIYNVDPDCWVAIQKHHRAILNKLLLANTSILDVGCGYGALYDILPKDRNLQYRGIDVSPDLIELAKARNPGVPFILADARDLHFYGHHTFDFAICRSVRGMIRDNLGEVYWHDIYKEVMRVAKCLVVLEYGDLDTYTIERSTQ